MARRGMSKDNQADRLGQEMARTPSTHPLARTEPEAQGTADPQAHDTTGTRAHGHEGPRAHGDAGTEAQGNEGTKHRRIVVYLPPDVAEALDAAYVAELAQRPTGPDRATRSQVAAELLRQALGL
jgi:hypothetical protein